MNAGQKAVLTALMGGRGGAINGFLNAPNYDEERQKDAMLNYGVSLMGSQNQNNTTSGAVRQLGERLLGAVMTGYREKSYRDKEKTLGEQWGAIMGGDAPAQGATMPMPKPMEGSTGDTAQDAASFEALAGGTAKGINPDDWAKRFGGATVVPAYGAKPNATYAQRMREKAKALYGDKLDPQIDQRISQLELMQSMMGEDPEKPVLKEIAGRLVHVYPDGAVREIADFSEQEAALRREGRATNNVNVNVEKPLGFGDAGKLAGVTSAYREIADLTKGLFDENGNFKAGTSLASYIPGTEASIYKKKAERAAEAWLRAQTGAAVTESEASRYAEMYIPMPWDTSAVAQDKLNALKRQYEDTTRFMMRNPYGEFTGSQPYRPSAPVTSKKPDIQVEFPKSPGISGNGAVRGNVSTFKKGQTDIPPPPPGFQINR